MPPLNDTNVGRLGAVKRMSEHDGKSEVTEAAIAHATREYYDARPRLGYAWDAEPAGDFPDIRPEQGRMEATLRGVVQRRPTLELACGTGSMTRVAAASQGASLPSTRVTPAS
jgi:hypothetical protein